MTMRSGPSQLMYAVAAPAGFPPDTPSLEAALKALDLDGDTTRHPESLPFMCGDTTVGAESELQAAVAGAAEHVDLALQIRASNYFSNVVRHAMSQETPRHMATAIETFLADNPSGIWENSWVRLPLSRLNDAAMHVLEDDLRARRGNPNSPPRTDRDKFFARDEHTGTMLRVPVSYLLKLALAHALGTVPRLPLPIHRFGRRLMNHYISDNASPEVLSFYIVGGGGHPGPGEAVAHEAAQRFLFTELLNQYAEKTFSLGDHGQRPLVYWSPHVPLRQRRVSEIVSDTFYRDLFCSPCLSGWDRGEEKHRYMQLCHEVLSRSHLNAVAKLRDAGIITRNLVVLPNTCNASLGNNGTHVSLGSERLRRALADGDGGDGPRHEKYLSDLVIKITEHFLPLFVGHYSAAPYRLDFTDFHPERILGYLPHQLDYTHLRKLWDGWRRKARNKVFGNALTPLGPQWLDNLIARSLQLRGDWVPDIRLLDYLVALSSTDQCPALDGSAGNHDRVKRDLADLGVFDPRMSFYMLYKPREYQRMGFSGFEARYFSLFVDIQQDLAPAVDLLRLITALAYHFMATGAVTHGHIPDTRFVESERRQVFFAAAMGLKAVYIRKDTPNRFLQRVLSHCGQARSSRRFGGYLKVYLQDYQLALISVLRRDGADLIAADGLCAVVEDLEARVRHPELHGAAARLNRGILDEAGTHRLFSLSAREYNSAAERYYRGTLKRRALEQAVAGWERDLEALARRRDVEPGLRRAFTSVLGDQDPAAFITRRRADILAGNLPEEELLALIKLLLTCVHGDATRGEPPGDSEDGLYRYAASVY
jgi:hypothetical protein